MKAGTDGWATGWKAVGSRAPTSQELWQMLYFAKQGGVEGIAWFPQAHGGAINDATPPELVSTLKAIADSLNPAVTPLIIPTPAAKTLVKSIILNVYSDGSFEIK